MQKLGEAFVSVGLGGSGLTAFGATNRAGGLDGITSSDLAVFGIGLLLLAAGIYLQAEVER